MSYDVDAPKERFNTEITREYFRKYRPEPEKRTIFAHWSVLNGPDSDIVLKTGSGLVYGSFAGMVACIHSNVQHTRGPFTLVGIAAQCFKHGTPWVIAGATYGVTVSLVTQMRKEEGAMNHMIAGYAAGTMLGSWYKWPMMGVWSGGILAVAAGLLKYWHDNDMLENKPLRRQRIFNMYRRGWLMDRPDAEGSDDGDKDVTFRHYKP